MDAVEWPPQPVREHKSLLIPGGTEFLPLEILSLPMRTERLSAAGSTVTQAHLLRRL